jgi:two-component system, LuxR family, sensor kinase FixL
MNSSVNTPSRSAETILIVDDDADAATCFRAILDLAGYQTVVAPDGRTALDLVRNRAVDMILLDVILPDADGVTLAETIKSTVGDEDFLPIVLVTAFANEKTKIAALSCADGFLAKPVSNAELVATVRSMVKIRRLTRVLGRTRDIYKRFYDHFLHIYASVNSAGVIIGANNLFCEFFHTTKEEIAGTSIFEFLRPEEDRAIFARFLDSVVKTDPIPQQNIFEFKDPDSPEGLRISVKAAAMDDAEAESGRAIVLALEDVTQKLQAEEERKIARRQLYRSAQLASVGTLASGVAHEMNNPLTAILGFSSALLSRANNNEVIDKGELGSYLQIIYNETIRCRDIVDHLHRFARESGEAKISRISLLSCIVSSLQFVNMKAARSEITILNEILDDVWILADANKLEQVFINLLTNCIDFCGPGTTVKITKVNQRRASRFVRVALRDNGPGMTPEVLAKAFDPFFTTKEVGKGIGMGLALCHKVIEELNGRIDIVSEPGKGTSVNLELPLEDGKNVKASV